MAFNGKLEIGAKDVVARYACVYTSKAKKRELF